MKRIIALLMLLILFIAPVTSLAEQKPIQFRGIEWGSSYSDVDSILNKEGISLSSNFENFHKNLDSLIYEESGSFDIAAAFSSSTFILENTSVAGYTVDDVTAYFAYREIDINTNLPNKENAIFFSAKYNFGEIVDYDAVYDNLLTKLSHIYGEPNDKREKSIVAAWNFVWYVWYDEFGNGIALRRETFDGHLDEITLWYFSANADELIQNSYDLVKAHALEEEAKKYGLDNLEGL